MRVANGDGQGIGGIRRLRQPVEIQQTRDHELHLLLLRQSISNDCGFNGQRSVFRHRQPVSRGSQQSHAAHMPEFQRGFYIDRVEDFFDRHGAYYAALLDYAAIGEPLLGEMAAQPRAILEALLAKKGAQARAALAYDIRRLRPILRETIRSLESVSDP